MEVKELICSMVDNSDFIVFYVNKENGGAKKTLDYVKRNKKKYINII